MSEKLRAPHSQTEVLRESLTGAAVAVEELAKRALENATHSLRGSVSISKWASERQ